jgi:UMF1 family MFS transporter
MLGLKNRAAAKKVARGENVLGKGFLQLWHTLKDIRHYPQTLLFLVAFLVYNDAIQAVITLSGQFGADYIKMPMEDLTLAILMVQFVAVAGALIFNVISRRTGAKRAVEIALVIWAGLMIVMYGVKTPTAFFAAAAVVAIVMGGSQALSRSLYSLMIPKGREAEYFSLYEVSDKGTSWLAPLIFGLTLQYTGSYQYAILSLIVFFILGLVLLAKVDVKKAAREAGNEAP